MPLTPPVILGDCQSAGPELTLPSRHYLDRFKSGGYFMGPFAFALGAITGRFKPCFAAGHSPAPPPKVMDFMKYSQVVYYSPSPRRVPHQLKRWPGEKGWAWAPGSGDRGKILKHGRDRANTGQTLC